MRKFNRFESILVCLILFVAGFLRFFALGIKPAHFDEGINGHFVMQMWRDGFFRYDPSNFHGPLYFYLLQLSEAVGGFGVESFRAVTGVLSLLTVVLIVAHHRFFGRAALWAAAIYAISPAAVFYSRYAIHESLLILSYAIFSYGFFLSFEKGQERASWLWMVVAFWIAFATKETFFIFFGTWAIAFFMMRKLAAWGTESAMVSRPHSSWGNIFAAVAIITFFIYAGFGLHMQGVGDSLRAFAFWTKTGTAATGHEKPFLYWLQLMGRYEWAFAASLVVAAATWFLGRNMHWRFYSLMGVGMFLAYSLIPYKTPWCILNILLPLAFVFGFACEFILHLPQKSMRTVLGSGVLILVGFAIFKMLVLNFRDYANPQESYVYVQSTKDLVVLQTNLQKRVQQAPEDRDMKVLVFVKDTWPLPYLLSRFTNVQYIRLEPGTELPDKWQEAAVILIDPEAQGRLEINMRQPFFRMPFQLRDAYQSGFAYFRSEKFKDIVGSNAALVVAGSAP